MQDENFMKTYGELSEELGRAKERVKQIEQQRDWLMQQGPPALAMEILEQPAQTPSKSFIRMSVLDRVVMFLEERPKDIFSAAMLAEAIDYDMAKLDILRTVLSRAVGDGKIMRIHRGMYASINYPHKASNKVLDNKLAKSI